MLALHRREKEIVLVRTQERHLLTLMVVEIAPHKVRLGFEAPGDVAIERGELSTNRGETAAWYMCRHCGRLRAVTGRDGLLLAKCDHCNYFDFMRVEAPQQTATAWCPECDRTTNHNIVSARLRECSECGELSEITNKEIVL